MADIFISYSSKDREKADQLIELLASAGLSVWIDKQGIDVATSWSEEIVTAIDECKAFIILLSPNSIESHNVVKEVSLASEKKKKILPLDLEHVPIPRSMQYALAGIQRTAMTNIDAIIRAIGKLGLEATKAPEIKLVRETDSRKSLMILPFEDLSPTRDNDWFTDGIASELINTLSNIKVLKLIDWNTSKLLKNKAVRTLDLAKDFSVRYFVEGQVRKFGDSLKISMTLLDIETGDHLWQDSMKGTMTDIFDIQEEAAKKVLAGLDVILSKNEEEKLSTKLTENAEAYELWLKGNDYHTRHTKSDYERALGLYEEAVRLDSTFAMAHATIAETCTEIYRQYDRSPERLVRAEQAVERLREINGETPRYFSAMSNSALIRGDAERALILAERAIEIDPKFPTGYDVLAWALKALGRTAEAADMWEKGVRLLDTNANMHFNLLVSLNELLAEEPASAERRERLRAAAESAIPIYERYVRLAPDDYYSHVQLATVLQYAGRNREALSAAEELEAVEALDGNGIYNLACIYLQLNDSERGLRALRRAVDRGFREIELFRSDPDLAPLRGMPEFEQLVKEVEASNG